MIPEDIYAQIVGSMPIPCVDLLVEDGLGRVLLVKRADEPAKGQWWFPGGRIYYRELRSQAALRKLREECGLTAASITEIGTYDVILEMPGSDYPKHGITTLFHAVVKDHSMMELDNYILTADWLLPAEWLEKGLHEFVRAGLNILLRTTQKGM